MESTGAMIFKSPRRIPERATKNVTIVAALGLSESPLDLPTKAGTTLSFESACRILGAPWRA